MRRGIAALAAYQGAALQRCIAEYAQADYSQRAEDSFGKHLDKCTQELPREPRVQAAALVRHKVYGDDKQWARNDTAVPAAAKLAS